MTDKKELEPVLDNSLLVNDIRQMIESTRSSVATAVNIGLTMLYWRIGKRIHEEILLQERAEYGKEILATLGRQLTKDFGKGFEEKNLRRMIQFADLFQEEEIVATLSRQLSWSHFKEIIPLKDPLQREFYAEMCRVERWSVRTLRKQIDSMLFERTAISRKPEDVIQHELTNLREQDRISTELIFRDPYILDFLGLKDRYLEKDLEDAILRELETFLLELGGGFAFVARQKRIQIDSDDFYIDLLFYHRTLHRLVAIDLKLGNSKQSTRARWNSTCGGWTNTNANPARNHPLALSSAPERKRSRSSCWNWTAPASTWPNTSPSCHPVNS